MPATPQSPLIIGHRGASAVAPENTLAAFVRAFADGADGVEFDVRLARDGVPVVIHDSTLARTGNTKRSVAEMTSAELRRADVGNWFNRSHPRLARDEYARQSVPTLEQVFAILKSSGRNSVAYLELKIDKGDAYADLVSSVAELITQHELERRIVVVSFNLKALALVKELNSSIRIGALFEPKGGLTTIVRKQRMIRAAVDCAADEILLHRRLAGHGIFELAKANKLQPVVWTVDDPKWISRAMALGIHALITNDPSGILEAQVY